MNRLGSLGARFASSISVRESGRQKKHHRDGDTGTAGCAHSDENLSARAVLSIKILRKIFYTGFSVETSGHRRVQEGRVRRSISPTFRSCSAAHSHASPGPGLSVSTTAPASTARTDSASRVRSCASCKAIKINKYIYIYIKKK